MVVNGASQKTRQLMYMLPQGKKAYVIMPEQKQYIQMEFSDDLSAKMKKQSNDPREFLRQIINSKYTDIGKSVIDGVEVEGFETTDPVCIGGMAEDVKVTLWVDRKTELPVREEMHYKMNEQMQMEVELYDFQWYVQVNADEFKPVIPQDYTNPLPNYKMPTMSEEGAIEGLRFCNQMLGRYPKKIDMMNLMNEVASEFRSIEDSNNPQALKLREIIVEKLGLQGNMKGQMSKLSQEEKTKKITEFTMEVMRPVQSLSMFYMTLVQEKKEPAYYGDVVGPKDANQVLMRWKVSDNEYRVIYGDLRAETVTAERLAELEVTLPNEETAIQGLKLLVELVGKYPDPNMNLSDSVVIWSGIKKMVIDSETPAALQLKEELKGLTEEETNSKFEDLLMPIRGLIGFCIGLERDNKDIGYVFLKYGRALTTEDADKVLMRWKVSDNEYRVIYGDLHVETVTPAKLAELEAALPK
jgi:hypothetical protein